MSVTFYRVKKMRSIPIENSEAIYTQEQYSNEF